MSLDIQYVSLDISKRPTPQQVRLGQGDANGTQLVVSIFDGGTAYSLANKSVRLALRLPGNDAYYEVSGTASNNTATFNIDETYAASSHGSDGFGYVDVMSGSTVICSTSRCQLVVLRSAEDGADPSTSYTSGIIEATQAANVAAASATSAAGSATTAAENADAKAGLADSAATAANSAASTANAAASTASSNAAAAASAASQANSAATAANSAAEAANDATEDTEAATAAALAAIDAMGDISELAVPEMSANIRGGAKLGVGLDVSDGKLNIDLSDSGSGSSVLTNGCALLDVEGDGWAEQDGTPTPENPVPVRVAKGRNLCNSAKYSSSIGAQIANYDTLTTYTSDGITFTRNQDGSIHVTGTASGLVSILLALDHEIQAGETVTLSGCPADGSTTKYRLDMYRTASAIEESDYGNNKTKTLGNAVNRIRIAVYAGTWDLTFKPQLELGTAATPYVPYGHVGLEIKQGSTLIDCIPVPIPEEGLASVRDGTKDLLSIDSAGHVVAGKRVQRLYFDGTDSSGWLAEGSYASTGGGYYRYDNRAYGSTAVVTASGFRSNYFNNIAVLASAQDNAGKIGIGNTYALPRIRTVESTAPQTVETLMAQFQANPFELFLPLATPTTIDMGYIDLPLMPDGCTVSIPELHEIDVEWVVTRAEAIPEMVSDVRKWALHEIALAGDAELSTIAAVENATASTNYAVGSYLVHAGTLYRVTTAIATGETITPGSNVTATTVMAEIIRLTA